MVKCFLLTKAAGPIGQSCLGWSYGKRAPRPSRPIMALERGGPDNFLPPNRHNLAAEPGSWLLAYPQLWSSAGGPILIGTLFYRKTALLLSNHHAQHTTPTHPRPHHSTLHSLAIVRSALSLPLSLPPVYPARGRVHSRSTSGKKKPCLSSVSPPVAPRPRPSSVQPPCGPPPPVLWSQPAPASALPRACELSTTRSRLRNSATGEDLPAYTRAPGDDGQTATARHVIARPDGQSGSIGP